MQPFTLTLVARILPPLSAVALSTWVTWSNMIAFFGGTIPLTGWELEGGFLTGVLWGLLVSGTISGLARTALMFLLKGIGKVIPLTVAVAPANTPAAAASSDGDGVLS